MVIPGYDPEDLDDTLEALLDDDEIAEYLTDDQWQSYRDGDESLVDLLDSSEIERVLDKKGASVDSAD